MSIGGWLTLFGVFVLTVAMMAWAMRRAGRDAEKALNANEVIHAAEIRAQVESDNLKLSDDDLRNRLRVVK